MNREHCRKQIARLGDMLPKTTESRKNLIDALDRWTVSDEHATAVVQTVIDTLTFCPSPAELRTIAFNSRPEVAAYRGCVECAASPGWVVRRQVVDKGPFRGDTVEGVVPCKCRSDRPNVEAAREVETTAR